MKFSPTVDAIICTSGQSLKLWDVSAGEKLKSSPSLESVQSFSWSSDGSLLVCSDKTSSLSIWDPRENSSSFGVSFAGHEGDRNSRVKWLGDSTYLLSTGFNKRRAREGLLWDTRSPHKAIACISEMEPSKGVWIPLFDEDSTMLFLVSSNGSAVLHWELSELLKSPAAFGEVGNNKFSPEATVKGAGLVPKRALKVMDAEVNRVLLYTSSGIAPLSYTIPRKTYSDFHSDLFPLTRSPYSYQSVNEWTQIRSFTPARISLNPRSKDAQSLIRVRSEFGNNCNDNANCDNGSAAVEDFNCNFEPTPEAESNNTKEITHVETQKPQAPAPQVKPLRLQIAKPIEIEDKKPETPAKIALARDDSVRKSVRKAFTTRTTKFRHLKGKVLGKEHHITNIPALCRTVPGECNYFKVNRSFCAVPVGNSNQLAILKASGKRLERGLLPCLMTGSASIGDFAFDPFNDQRIAVACSDSSIKIWTLPAEGLLSSIEKPDYELRGHNDRVTIVEFHPLASDVLTTASVDLTIRIWNLESREQLLCLKAFTDPIFAFSWHPEGKTLAVFSKDHKIKVFSPREDEEKCIQEGPGPQGSRGGRLCWLNNGSQLAVIGFSKVSERQVMLFAANDLQTPLATEGIDVNPAILIPFYDEGSSTLFLTGKGDTTVFAFEISPTSDGAPYIHHLSHFNCPAPHQSVAFLPKIACDVKGVEFAKSFRLTNNSVEPVSFTVPRLRSEYFQDDIFPPQRVTWEPALSASQWLSGKDVPAKMFDLRPADMEPLSSAPAPPPTPKKPVSSHSAKQDFRFEGNPNLESSLSILTVGRRQQEKLVTSISDKIAINAKLEQKSFEGVADEEWDESD